MVVLSISASVSSEFESKQHSSFGCHPEKNEEKRQRQSVELYVTSPVSCVPGASAVEVNLFGATLTSWTVSGEELIFIRFDGSIVEE
jgi:hypothetical protein